MQHLMKSVWVLVLSISMLAGCGGGGGGTSTPVPAIAIVSPTNNDTVVGDTPVSASVVGVSVVSKVEFYLNNAATPAYTTLVSPYIWPWDTRSVTNGTYLLTAKAYDGSSNVISSTPTLVDVSNPTSSLSTDVSTDPIVSTLSISGISSNICGFDVSVKYPTGVTFSSASATGVASGSFIESNADITNNTVNIALISTTGFSSGEVARLNFTPAAVNASDFYIVSSSFKAIGCP
ncbi:MAG: hypothetical protein HZC44_09330 [Geobacter sp.]|nr:hypothetical protein [Geobacter sp.]